MRRVETVPSGWGSHGPAATADLIEAISRPGRDSVMTMTAGVGASAEGLTIVVGLTIRPGGRAEGPASAVGLRDE